MTGKSYIPDENIIILAHQQEDERGNPDPTCLQLLQRLLKTPEVHIVLDHSLWAKYRNQAQKQRFHSDLRNPIHEIFIAGIGPPDPDGSWPYKITLLENAPCFPEETKIPAGSQDDLQIVRLAVHTRATLVTTDQPLIQGLETAGITAKYDLTVLSPAQALRQFPPEKEGNP